MKVQLKFLVIVLSFHCHVTAIGNPVNSEQVQEVGDCKNCNEKNTFQDDKSVWVTENEEEKDAEIKQPNSEDVKIVMTRQAHDSEEEDEQYARSFLGSRSKIKLEDVKRIAEYFMNGGPLIGSPFVKSCNSEKEIPEPKNQCEEPIVGAARENPWCPADLLGIPQIVPTQPSYTHSSNDQILRTPQQSQAFNSFSLDQLPQTFVDMTSAIRKIPVPSLKNPKKNVEMCQPQKTPKPCGTKKDSVICELKNDCANAGPKSGVGYFVQPVLTFLPIVNSYPVPAISRPARQKCDTINNPVNNASTKIESHQNTANQQIEPGKFYSGLENLLNFFEISTKKDLQMAENNSQMSASSLQSTPASANPLFLQSSWFPNTSRSMFKILHPQVARNKAQDSLLKPQMDSSLPQFGFIQPRVALGIPSLGVTAPQIGLTSPQIGNLNTPIHLAAQYVPTNYTFGPSLPLQVFTGPTSGVSRVPRLTSQNNTPGLKIRSSKNGSIPRKTRSKANICRPFHKNILSTTKNKFPRETNQGLEEFSESGVTENTTEQRLKTPVGKEKLRKRKNKPEVKLIPTTKNLVKTEITEKPVKGTMPEFYTFN